MHMSKLIFFFSILHLSLCLFNLIANNSQKPGELHEIDKKTLQWITWLGKCANTAQKCWHNNCYWGAQRISRLWLNYLVGPLWSSSGVVGLCPNSSKSPGSGWTNRNQNVGTRPTFFSRSASANTSNLDLRPLWGRLCSKDEAKRPFEGQKEAKLDTWSGEEKLLGKRWDRWHQFPPPERSWCHSQA